MDINEISGAIVGLSIKIHQKLGPGLLETVYQRILCFELLKAGFTVESEVPIPIEWDGHILADSFRTDIIVNGCVLVELKSVEKADPGHRKQILTYLKLANIRLGHLINFGAELLKDDLHRLIIDIQE